MKRMQHCVEKPVCDDCGAPVPSDVLASIQREGAISFVYTCRQCGEVQEITCRTQATFSVWRVLGG